MKFKKTTNLVTGNSIFYKDKRSSKKKIMMIPVFSRFPMVILEICFKVNI